MIVEKRPRRWAEWRVAMATFLLGLLGCFTYRPYRPGPENLALLSIGERLSFVGYELTFYENGLVVYREGGPRDETSYLHPRDLCRLKAFLDSEDFSLVLKILSSNGYQPGCCDGHEVAFSFDGATFGYSLWHPSCQERVVEEPVARFIDLVNDLGANHFFGFRRHPLPKTTCDSRQTGG